MYFYLDVLSYLDIKIGVKIIYCFVINNNRTNDSYVNHNFRLFGLIYYGVVHLTNDSYVKLNVLNGL
jgi:hypothetical protein